MSTEITINQDIVDINVTETVVVIEAPSGAYPLPTGVFSVFGRSGNVVAAEGDYNLNLLGDVTLTSPSNGQVLKYNGTAWVNGSDNNAVTSVFGRTGAITAQSGDYNTLQVTENTNLYFTDQRARYAISGDATSGVVYQNTTGIIALDDIPNTSLLNSSVTVNGSTVALGGSTSFSTTAVAEGTNLYYTDARARAAISGTAPISVTSGVVSISQANSTTNGYLSSADWNTFNGKQAALTLGNLTSSDITVTGGTGAVVGNGSTLTLATVNSNVGQFGSSTAIPVITVNGKGLVTAMSTTAVSIPSGALNFIGDVTGSGTTGSDTTLTLATVNSNVGSYGTSTSVPTITVNAKGLVTSASQTAIPTASSSVTGLLSSTDWSTFNAKQAQLNGTGFVKVSGTTVSYDNSTYLTTIEGIAAGGELSGTYASPSLVNSAVTGKVLTGLNVTGGTVSATDSILAAFGKVQNQINGLIGGSIYQGTWNASTNTPALASGVGTKGYYYIVSVAGTTNLDGITDWAVGDWAIYDGTAWQQVDNTDAVVSVNGFTGAVSLTTSNINEGTNLYYTDARARGSVSAGTGISYNSTTGVITNSAPDQTVSLTASTGISTSGTYPNFTITNTAPDQTVSLTSGTGISATGTYPNFTITNTAPDQTVSLTGAGTTSISGTYPNFTITSNDQYVGTVTSVGITESAAALTITGSPVTTSGNINIGFAGNSGQYVAGDGSLVTFPSVVTQAQNLVTEVYNSTGATLTKGTVVYINGGQGNLPTVTKAIASSDSTSAQTYGVVRTDITNNNNGYVTVIGNIDNVDTQAYTAGTQLYLSGTTAGAWTSTKPYAPIHLVYVGIVVRSHPTQGVVEIRIQNGYEMDELHDVSAQSPNNGDILQYVSSTSLWTKTAGTTSAISEGSNLYFTDARARAAISLTTTGNNGASTYNSTTGVLNVPTYTLAGLGGINLTSLSATSPLLYDNTTGVFSIQQSNALQAGFLSSADWTTFNNKVPSTRTLSINGTAYDLSADRSWTITPNVNATYTQDYTATAAQTTFTVTGGYTVGQLAVFYNGSKLAAAEFTATNGTTFVLATACQANDIVQAVVSVTGGGIGGSGTTNYLAKFSASGVVTSSSIFDNGNVGIGTTSPNVSNQGSNNKVLTIQGLSGSYGMLEIGATTNTTESLIGVLGFTSTNVTGGLLGFISMASEGTTGTNVGGRIQFNIKANGGGISERMRITSGGNVCIGTSSGTSALVTKNTGSGTFAHMNDGNTTDNGTYPWIGSLNNSDVSAATYGWAFYNSGSDGNLRLYRRNGSTTGDLVMTFVRSTGQVGIGTNTGAGRLNVLANPANNILVEWQNSAGVTVGTVTVVGAGTQTAYNTSSDYRLKEDLQEIKGLEKLSKVKVYDFKWKGFDERMDGVLAHELAEVLPYAVSGEKDGEEMQGVDYSKLVPVLVKSIQELEARIKQLENK